ncbi:hydratase [Colwellia echini]|uniref:Hydratase n=1 Tax=Colwellia echini TaxID=1982103 RepID=A0ABY3MW69_9GAMM|nr:hydratase [Colwellia echini]TYK65458.1 hydratase [Colwellia echini]
MTTQKFNEAAQQFLARRVPGTKADSLPEAIRPISIEDALMVHQEMIKLRSDGVAGWKCLLPLAEDKIIMAPIFSDTFQYGEQCSLMKDNGVARVEPEIVFVLNKDLPARDEDYSEAEINDAIGSCHMALELMQSRFAEDCTAEFAERLADCLLNQGLYIGPEIDRDLAFAASKIQLSFKQTDANGEVTEKNLDGVHPNPLPQLPVYWAINMMSKRGTTFKKGEAFTTGSYKGIVEVDFDKKTEISYAGIGSYTVTFKELV